MSVPSLPEGSEFFFFLGALGAAVLGGWHCAGMCGPIAGLARSRVSVVAYQLGRLVSYAALGAFAGVAGEHVMHLLPREHLWLASLVLGVLALWLMLSVWKLGALAKLQSFLWRKRPRGSVFVEYFAVGTLNGILPCHWLYGFLVLAAGLASPARAAIFMLSLWAGSLPWLVAVSLLGRRLERSRIFGPWLAPAMMIAVVVSLFLHQLHQSHHQH